MHNWWPPEVQAHEQHLFHVELKDTWIFRNRCDGMYFAIGGIDPIGIQTLMMVADIVKYTSQQLRDVKFSCEMGYYR